MKGLTIEINNTNIDPKKTNKTCTIHIQPIIMKLNILFYTYPSNLQPFYLTNYLAITTPSTCMQDKTLHSTTVTYIGLK